MTWKDSLIAVFEGFNSAEEIDPDNFLNLLRKKGVLVKDFKESFNELAPGKKKEVIEDLWKLAHQDDMSPTKRLELYDRVAGRYERFFEWEETSFPGDGWGQP
jgi:hypothetical protein